MERRGIVIEQLYEDFHTDVFTSGPKPEDKAKSDSEKGKTRRSQSVSSSTNSKSSNIPAHYGQAATSTSAARLGSRKSTNGSPASSARSRKSSHTPVSGPSHDKGPFSPTSAIAMFKDKLTKYELSEIHNFTHVFYAGVSAKKLAVESPTGVTGYDDEESFYRVVPRDHIAYRYEVVDKPLLGKGTFGQVVKAYDHKDKKLVAVKLVRNERIYLKQSREELRILQVLKKQDTTGSYNIVQIINFFMFRNHMCFVFELLGMNLYQVLKRNHYRGLGTAKILLIARSVLKCLELLFKNRIIHCDIKPENIMLRRNGDFTSVKVGDFGSSCYEQQQIYHYIQSRYYRAPEVLLGTRYGPAIDMWSLGCVLGELSTGYPLFVGSDEGDQMASIEEVMGSIPPHLIAKASGKMDSLMSRRPGRGRPGTKPLTSVLVGDDNFKGFVAKMLEWDPIIRPSPMEMQEHRWLKMVSKNALPSSSHPGILPSNKHRSSSHSDSAQM